MLIKIRPKAHSAYRSLPILGPIVDEFTDWALSCGYEVKSFGSQLGNIRHLGRFFYQRGLGGGPRNTTLSSADKEEII